MLDPHLIAQQTDGQHGEDHCQSGKRGTQNQGTAKKHAGIPGPPHHFPGEVHPLTPVHSDLGEFNKDMTRK
jgi:hypothetical protein